MMSPLVTAYETSGETSSVCLPVTWLIEMSRLAPQCTTHLVPANLYHPPVPTILYHPPVPVTLYHPPCTYFLIPSTLYLLPCTIYLVCTICLGPITLYYPPCTYFLIPSTLYLLPCTIYLVCTICLGPITLYYPHSIPAMYLVPLYSKLARIHCTYLSTTYIHLYPLFGSIQGCHLHTILHTIYCVHVFTIYTLFPSCSCCLRLSCPFYHPHLPPLGG